MPSATTTLLGEVVIATRNRGKSGELRALLDPFATRVLDLTDVGVGYDEQEEEIEDGATFMENAIAKARYFAARCGGRAVLADDSGLCVTALGGAPGVRSRRYSGVMGDDATVSRANSDRLLHALAGVSDRGAEFVATVAYASESSVVTASGTTRGHILLAPCGAHGFGYDPVFWSDDLRCSFGEAPTAEKARVSHRGRAVNALVAQMRGEATADPA